jgi:hypothetical protein
MTRVVELMSVRTRRGIGETARLRSETNPQGARLRRLSGMDLEFSGEVWHWKGPAPHHFVTVPEDECEDLAETAAMVSYGWGMIPVTVRIGGTEWTTSLWPKDGRYIVPLRLDVRRREGIDVGDTVTVRLAVGV